MTHYERGFSDACTMTKRAFLFGLFGKKDNSSVHDDDMLRRAGSFAAENKEFGKKNKALADAFFGPDSSPEMVNMFAMCSPEFMARDFVTQYASELGINSAKERRELERIILGGIRSGELKTAGYGSNYETKLGTAVIKISETRSELRRMALTKVAAFGEYPLAAAWRSLGGLAAPGGVARFMLEDDPTRKQDYKRYVLHATNPKIDYGSDRFQSLLDQFVNVNLMEMRKRKMRRLLLDVVKRKRGEGGRGSYYPDDYAHKGVVSDLNNDSLSYMFAKKPWTAGIDGTFVSSNGKPLLEIPTEGK